MLAPGPIHSRTALLEREPCRQLHVSGPVYSAAGDAESIIVIRIQSATVGDSKGVLVESVQELSFETQSVTLIDGKSLDDAEVVVEVCRRANLACCARNADTEGVGLIQACASAIGDRSRCAVAAVIVVAVDEGIGLAIARVSRSICKISLVHRIAVLQVEHRVAGRIYGAVVLIVLERIQMARTPTVCCALERCSLVSAEANTVLEARNSPLTTEGDRLSRLHSLDGSDFPSSQYLRSETVIEVAMTLA